MVDSYDFEKVIRGCLVDHTSAWIPIIVFNIHAQLNCKGNERRAALHVRRIILKLNTEYECNGAVEMKRDGDQINCNNKIHSDYGFRFFLGMRSAYARENEWGRFAWCAGQLKIIWIVFHDAVAHQFNNAMAYPLSSGRRVVLDLSITNWVSILRLGKIMQANNIT